MIQINPLFISSYLCSCFCFNSHYIHNHNYHKGRKTDFSEIFIHSRCGIGIGVCFFFQYIIRFPTFKTIIMQAKQVALGSAMMKIFEEDLWKIFSFWKVKYHKTLVAIQQQGSFFLGIRWG